MCVGVLAGCAKSVAGCISAVLKGCGHVSHPSAYKALNNKHTLLTKHYIIRAFCIHSYTKLNNKETLHVKY